MGCCDFTRLRQLLTHNQLSKALATVIAAMCFAPHELRTRAACARVEPEVCMSSTSIMLVSSGRAFKSEHLKASRRLAARSCLLSLC